MVKHFYHPLHRHGKQNKGTLTYFYALTINSYWPNRGTGWEQRERQRTFKKIVYNIQQPPPPPLYTHKYRWSFKAISLKAVRAVSAWTLWVWPLKNFGVLSGPRHRGTCTCDHSATHGLFLERYCKVIGPQSSLPDDLKVMLRKTYGSKPLSHIGQNLKNLCFRVQANIMKGKWNYWVGE